MDNRVSKYLINRNDLKNYLSEEELARYYDGKRIEVLLITIIQGVAQLESKAEIQTFLISMLDQNARELNDLDKTVLANREWEKSLMEGELDETV